MRRRNLFLFTAAVALVLAPSAAAHVTVNPDAVAADSFARFAIRVPTERENASTTKVTVRLPRGLFFVSFQPKPGWKRTITTAKLDPPAEVFGEQVTERVATVTWEGGRIAPGEFDEFGMSAKVPNAVGTKLTFPSVQTYSNGEIVRWIGPPDAEEPAPRVTLEAAETETAAQPTPQPSETEGDEEGEEEGEDRANLALGLGVVGLLAGLAALGLNLFRRRP
jgi:periplasmic copper chaperone A